MSAWEGLIVTPTSNMERAWVFKDWESVHMSKFSLHFRYKKIPNFLF